MSQTYAFAEGHRNQILRAIFTACLFLVVVYIFNVYSVISRTVALQKMQVEIAAAGKSVQALDTQYLELSSRLTPDGLGAYGFREGRVSTYISRTPFLGKVALGGHEL